MRHIRLYSVELSESRSSEEDVVEGIYDSIKDCVKEGVLNHESVAAIADLTTELANRLKVEESGEQEG